MSKTNSKVIEVEAAEKHLEEEIGANEPGMFVLFVTEIVGTAMLLFLGCMGVCVPEIIDLPVVPHFGGLGFGLSVLIVIQVNL